MTSITEPGRGVRTSPARSQRSRLRRYSRRDRLLLVFLIGIPLVMDIAFIWFPAIASIALSFTQWDGIGGLSAIKGAGLSNYHTAFTVDPSFWPAVRHNVYWLLVFGLLATPLGMLFAVVIDRNIRGSRIYQSILFLPVMLSLALIGIIWELMYNSNLGLINTIIGRTGNRNAIDWLGNPHLNIWAVMVEACWRQAGYVMVLYLAGLKSVDPTLREAAALDGANRWKMFWRVIFPVMKPINIVVLVVTVIESLRAYDLVYITSKGNGLPGLELLSFLVTQNLVGQSTRIGYGSALAVVLLVVSLIPICTFLWQTFRREEYR